MRSEGTIRHVRMMAAGCLLFGSLWTMSAQAASPVVGWYNGEWQSGVPGLANYYASGSNFSRVYDDFIVPEGGWTITGVFSDDNLYDFPAVNKASWEIRSGLKPGKGGKVVASGRSPATQKLTPLGYAPGRPLFRIQVEGLSVKLPPGRYWLSVSPVGSGQSVICATRGAHAIGDPPGNNGGALLNSSQALFIKWGPSPSASPVIVPSPRNSHFEMVEAVGSYGQQGLAKDFSQGVLIAPR